MSKQKLLRRYFLFLCSVFTNAFSIAVITKALLGTSPISSVPYVLSLFTPYTMGQFTIAMNLGFILLEMALMKRTEIKEKRYELMTQVPITICFGVFIDLSMYLISWLSPTFYIAQIVTLLGGCFILGVGISLEVKANVAMVTGEYLVQVISKFTHREFGFIKVCFDITLVLIACTLSLVFMHRLEGVREGTVIAALTVGPISYFIRPYWRIFDNWLAPASSMQITAAQGDAIHKSHPLVITIAREFGSGGQVLGQMIAKELGIKYYDKELIALVAKESNLSEKYIIENEQMVSSNYLLHIIMQDYEAPIEKSLSSADALFVSQSRIIRQIAHEQPCVIIGRCADYILEDFPKESVIKIFCYTDMESAYKRCTEQYHLNPTESKTEIARINRARISHYQHYTNRKWGDPHSYDLMVNTSSLSLENACTLITQLYHKREQMSLKLS